MKGLTRQLALLKELVPATSILVIGVSDMASKQGDTLRSFENIPYIIDAQKKAASDAGVAFWDSYRAMGGEASIISWASREIPLAQKDYVHFTYTGADTISAMLAKALFTLKQIDTLSTYTQQIQVDTVRIIQSDSSSITDEKSYKGITGNLITEIFSYDSSRPLIFTSPAFWLFFLIVLLGYSLIYKKNISRNFYLFCLSLFFYYKSGGIFLILLILVTCVDFFCGLLIHHSNKKIYRKFFVLLSIVSNLGILAYFKYTEFFITSANNLFGTDFKVYDYLASFSNQHLGSSFEVSSIILPVGISLFTFQSLSYTFDIYRDKIKPVTNILDFGFFVSFFPQLVAGPIVRASEFIPQLYTKYHLEKREFSQALFLISKGLIKKIVISDFIAVNFIDRVFEMPALYSGFENLMAVYGYGLQIYCDFSGYTDIAIGVALILGFRLPINFNSPYKAADLADFWRRWHISLSRWLKDYLYIPLGGNKKGKFRTGINLLITMLLGGLWHGAALRFIIWGGLHGIGLIISRIWNKAIGNRMSNRLGKAVAVFITFNFVSFCWIFFRADDMNTVTVILKQIFENFSPGSYFTVIPAYSTVFILVLVGYIIHFLPERSKESYRGLFIKSPLIAQLLIVMVVAVLLYQMRSTDVVPFIYFRF
jgi:D-alanyl-lipoteichoic acid acyltransferase DltB (MBOAT superfamily)